MFNYINLRPKKRYLNNVGSIFKVQKCNSGRNNLSSGETDSILMITYNKEEPNA